MVQFQTWRDLFAGSFELVWRQVVLYIPNLIIAIVIFIVGWIVGALIGKVVEHIIRILKVDTTLKSTHVERIINQSGFTLNIGAFVGGLVKWFIVLVFLLAALQVLSLTQVTEFLQNVILTYLPQVIVAVFILVVAAVVSDVVEKIVTGSAKAANLRHAKFLGAIVRWAIWIFALIAALIQLRIAPDVLQALVNGVVVAFSLAIGLAFGLGGQDAARDYIAKVRKELPHDSAM